MMHETQNLNQLGINFKEFYGVLTNEFGIRVILLMEDSKIYKREYIEHHQ